MNDRLAKAEALFHEALELPSEERERFLQKACGEDADLRREVAALLRASGIADHWIKDARCGAAAPSLSQNISESPGTVIGRYKLLEKIGEGGFGVVYMAEQEAPVRRRVALKIIKLGMDTKQVVARFEAERQALALMDHPSIAKVLDAGATDTGRPFFVMELVRGIQITEYCHQNNLSTERRLELFKQVCQAVQHAHQKGIIHRDLKPSNILVTLDGGMPYPMVIDFGVAKAINQRLTEKTLFTNFAQMIGTPAYMSPEQAEMSKLDVDTRSDVYSLGVLLYELLTGTTPFPEERLRSAGYVEMQRIIVEEEPPRPSTRMTQQRSRTVNAGKLEIRNSKFEIDRDLDWIVMKCLEKDRARRYDTANGLVADLNRHLTNEPVEARPPSAAYKLQKAWRRNKVVFTAGATVAASIVVGLVVSIWMFLRERHARSEADHNTATITRNLYFAEMNLAGQAAADPGGIRQVAVITAKWLPQNETADQRGWEWYYLRSLIHSDLFTLNVHTNSVLSVAWSRNGILASASADTIKLWDPLRRTNVFILRGHTDLVLSVAWSPDGTRLASGSQDQSIKVWDAASGHEILTLPGHTDTVSSVAWSVDGKQLASGSWDRTIKVWDAVSGANTRTLRGSHGLNSVAWSPDGKHLASANGDSTKSAVIVWDAVSEQVVQILKGHSPPSVVNSVAWSPDGKRLASVSNDHKVIVWDAVNWTNITTLLGHTDQTLSVAWSHDGKLLASASSDSTIRIWDADGGTNVLILRGHTNGVHSVAWSPEGKHLASGSDDKRVKVWNADREETLTLRGHTDVVNSVAWSPDGKLLASSSWDTTIKVWDADHGTNMLSMRGHPDTVYKAVWSPDGKHLASASMDNTVRVWDALSGTNILARVGEDTSGLVSVAWSPDGKRLAWSGWHQTDFNILEVDRQTNIRVRGGHKDWVFSALWSPDGKLLASGSRDGTVEIWDAAKWQLIRTLAGHSAAVRSVSWSPGGKRLASASFDGTVKVFDSVGWTNIFTLSGHTGAASSVDWSPDGKRLATGSFDHTIKIWDADSGQETLTLRGHTGQIQSVAWSPDGKRLASAGRDKTLRVWDARKAYALERE